MFFMRYAAFPVKPHLPCLQFKLCETIVTRFSNDMTKFNNLAMGGAFLRKASLPGNAHHDISHETYSTCPIHVAFDAETKRSSSYFSSVNTDPFAPAASTSGLTVKAEEKLLD